MLKIQNKFEILTPEGWSDFDGVQQKEICEDVATLTTEKRIITTTVDHKFMIEENKFVEVINLKPGDLIKTINGVEFIKNIKIHKEKSFVYDALNVRKNNQYFTNGLISHNCSFVGSVSTLISGKYLENLSYTAPLVSSEGISQYERPIEKNQYALIADVSRGKGLDYSTFSIFNITNMPYRQVCTFRDNMTGPVDFASIIFRAAKLYNEASVLVEINDIGGQVADVLHMDFGYENIMSTETAGRAGKRVSAGFGQNVDRGIRTTKTVKSVGCSILKMLVEQRQMIIPDFETIHELSRFSRKGNSYEAESGCHDDMVMTLVLFAWLTDQLYFKNITDINTIMKLREKTEEQMDANLLPFGFIVNSADDEIPSMTTTFRGDNNFFNF